MKPFFQKLPLATHSSFDYIRIRKSALSYPLHYHPEIELVYVNEYEGQMLFGDELFSPLPNDILLISADVAHANLPPQHNSGKQTDCSVFIFKPSIFGNDFYSIAEFTVLRQFVADLKGVLLFRESTVTNRLSDLFCIDEDKPKALQMLNLLRIMVELALESKSHHQLLSKTTISANRKECERIDTIYKFFANNFTKKIELDDISNLVHMDRASLSRYFKKVTQKNLFELLNEFRLQHASKLLAETNIPVTQIVFESGFNNISYFNKQFRAYKKCSPSEYRKQQLNMSNILNEFKE